MEGNNMKILGIVLAAAVSVIVLGSVLMPVFNETTETERTLTNEGYYRMSELNTSSSIVIDWEYQTPNQVKVNGTAISLASVGVGRPVTLVGCENFIVRYVDNSTDVIIQNVAGPLMAATVDTATNMHISISNGSMSVTVADETNNYQVVGRLFAINPNGNFSMKTADNTAYVNGDSEFILMGLTAMKIDTGVVGIGTIDNGTTLKATYGTNVYPDVTFRDVVIHKENTNGYTDVYSLEKVTFIATEDGGDYNVTYSYFIVPYQVTGSIEGSLTDGQISLLRAIPVMIIIGILMMVVGVIRSKEI